MFCPWSVFWHSVTTSESLYLSINDSFASSVSLKIVLCREQCIWVNRSI
jgi:hypothetical protein